MRDEEAQQVVVRSIPPMDTTCPLCGAQGEVSTFTTVFLCVTTGCRVWTYEAAPLPAGATEKPARQKR